MDVPHELGAVYAVATFFVSKALLAEYGLSASQVLPGGPEGLADILLDETSAHGEGRFSTLGDYTLSAVEEEWCGKDFCCLPNQLSALPLLKAVKRYSELHRQILGRYAGLMPPRPTAASWERMSMSFSEFLATNGLETLTPQLDLLVTANGYGYLDDVPAFYGLLVATPELLSASIASQQDPQGAEPLFAMLLGGFDALWARMVEQAGLDVRTGHAVTRIERSEDGVTCSGTRADGSTFNLEGSHVYLACPFATIAPSLADLSPEEAAIFQKLKPSVLATTLFEMDPSPAYQNRIAWWPDRIRPLEPGERPKGQPSVLYAHRWNAKAVYWPQDDLGPPAGGNRFLDPGTERVATSDAAKRGEKQLRVGYQLAERGASQDDAALRAQLKAELVEQLAGQGIGGVQVLKQEAWDYSYRFSQKDLEAGLPWDILTMQGARRTFYLGASASFETLNDVTNYNLTLERHFFPDRDGTPLRHRGKSLCSLVCGYSDAGDV